jgi:hypothetical protein
MTTKADGIHALLAIIPINRVLHLVLITDKEILISMKVDEDVYPDQEPIVLEVEVVSPTIYLIDVLNKIKNKYLITRERIPNL